MSLRSKIVQYVLMFAFVFLFGWESASYYISHQSPDNGAAQSDASAVNALSSFIGNSSPRANLGTFWGVWDLIYELYVDEASLNEQELIYGAIKGMVSAVGDPYTAYMTPDETIEFNQSLNGDLEGIGAELTVRDGVLVVVTPLKSSPAEKAGVLPGDIVYKIDGALTAEMTLFEAIMNIRGEKGTQVVLTIVRQGKDQPFDVPIVRDTVHVESVSMEEAEPGIFWMSINQFGDSTKAEFTAKVQELILKEPRGLVLDLRNNGGGYLELSVDILSEFLEGKVEAVTIKRRHESDNETLYVSGNPSLPTVPIVVLINDGSASAAEIVAGALQDHKRALLMGESSFGKGSVQEVDRLGDGSSLRITIAKWFTPGGQNIDEVGVTPDREVLFTEEDYKVDNDPQLDAAVEYLKSL